MRNFTFVSPTKIHFGVDALSKLVPELRLLNVKKLLLVYGMSSVKKSGLLKEVQSFLDGNVEYHVLENIEPNPKLSKVCEGVKIAKEFNPDLILALGGGSVIDTCKAIACNYFYDGDYFDYNAHLATPSKALKIGVILTHSAAGSELSNSCVITNDKTWVKNGFNTDLVRPVFAIMNPEYTFTLSKYQTACGVCDMFMHTFERYLNEDENNYFEEEMAKGLLRSVVKAGKKVMEDPLDYDARASLMIASSYAHNGLTSLGTPVYFTVHKLEHALSGKFDRISHATGLSALVTGFNLVVYKDLISKYASLGRDVFNVIEDNDELCALKCIEEIKLFFKSLGLPISLNELEVNFEDCTSMIDYLTKNGTALVPCFIKLDKDLVSKIFFLAL